METPKDPKGARLLTSGKPFTERDREIYQKDIAAQNAKKLNGHHLNGKKAHKAKKRKLQTH